MSKKAIVLGAGVTGAATAWQLAKAGYSVMIIEKASSVGGMSATFRHGEYMLDLGPHKLYTPLEHVNNVLHDLIGDDLLDVPKRSRIRLRNRFLEYPVSIAGLLTQLSPVIGLKCGTSYAMGLLKRTFLRREDRTYQDYIQNRFGRATYDLIFGPYASKIWGDPQTLDEELARARVVIPNLWQMLKQMVFKQKKEGQVLSVESFSYPRHGSGEIVERLTKRVEDTGGVVRFNSRPVEIQTNEHRITAVRLNDGQTLPVNPRDILVSTIPIEDFLEVLKHDIPSSVALAANRLKYRHLALIYVIIDKVRVSNDNWMFFPETEYIFNRVFEQKNFSPEMCPKATTCLCVEITCAPGDALDSHSDAALEERAVEHLVQCGLFGRDDVLETFTKRLDHAYPVFEVDYKKIAGEVLGYLDLFANLYSIGRQGGFNYLGMADCIDVGMAAVDHFLTTPGTDRKALRKRFDSYVVVD